MQYKRNIIMFALILLAGTMLPGACAQAAALDNTTSRPAPAGVRADAPIVELLGTPYCEVLGSGLVPVSSDANAAARSAVSASQSLPARDAAKASPAKVTKTAVALIKSH